MIPVYFAIAGIITYAYRHGRMWEVVATTDNSWWMATNEDIDSNCIIT